MHRVFLKEKKRKKGKTSHISRPNLPKPILSVLSSDPHLSANDTDTQLTPCRREVISYPRNKFSRSIVLTSFSLVFTHPSARFACYDSSSLYPIELRRRAPVNSTAGKERERKRERERENFSSRKPIKLRQRVASEATDLRAEEA